MKRLALALLLLAAPASAQMGKYDLKAQMARLAEWWPGRFDNHEQIVRQSGGGLSVETETPFFRMDTVVERVANSPLGDAVYKRTVLKGRGATMPWRVELDAVAPDPMAQGLRVRRFTADGTPLGAGCDLLLRYVGDQFQGATAGRCAAPGGFAEQEMALGATFEWVREQTIDRRGRTVAELAPGVDYAWFQQTRARDVACAVQGTATGDMKQAKYIGVIHLHDQGGEADIAWPDGRTLTFTVHTRAFSTPSSRENPLFRVHEKGNPVPIAYAYGVDGTPRFGLNLGWFYIRCYAGGDISPEEPGLTLPAPKP